MTVTSVAVIGSFRKYNSEIQAVCDEFRGAGLIVTSPQDATVLEPGIPFVRFRKDDADWSDQEIQALALHRIMRADLVYVVAPQGYVGRTTCYEIGRIVQRGRPVYFSAPPNDLPIHVPEESVVPPDTLIAAIRSPAWHPTWLFDQAPQRIVQLERGLLEERYIDG